MADALLHASRGAPDRAVSVLERLLESAEPSYAGWTIPIEPLLAPVRAVPGFGSVLGRLAERAR